MKLYFSPLACSLATRIALYEANADVTFEQVDSETKTTASGRDFRKIHELGLVPVLELTGGEVLTENAAVLQYVARRYPEARLAPTDPVGLARVQQWLCFIGTELHKGVFVPLLSKHAGSDAKDYALGLAEPRLAFLARQLQHRHFLLDRFTIADAYLFAVLNWTTATPVDLKRWPGLLEYRANLLKRPSIERAFSEELELYRVEQARRAAEKPAAPRSTREVIDRFNAAFLRHDPTLLDELIADDCVVENSKPAPLGARHVGREACLELWQAIARNKDAHFELEDVQIHADSAQIRWQYFWGAGDAESLRGVNLMRVRDGRIVEGRGYVKAG